MTTMTTAAHHNVLPDHVLTAILTLAKRKSAEERFSFRAHDYQIQDLFAQLSQKNYSVLKPFVFSDRGPEPYSPTLNESVARLQLSGLIGRENPDYAIVFLQPSAETFYDATLKSEFSEQQLGELQEIADTFLQTFA
jgi:hypothetical protein